MIHIESSTPSLERTPVELNIINNRVKWILWSDMNQLKQLTHYALIFDNKGNNKFTIISGLGNHKLELSSDPKDITIYGVKVVNGSFPIRNRQLCAETLGNIKQVMGILLPGFVNYLNDHSELTI
ncbi:Hypothetical protein HVR_LOCUS347 [uncultured virus]|nr:Hypothetical protein HVR_LOCUS347 [uncultured virus]